MSISFVVDFFMDWFLIFGISSPWFSLVFELCMQKDELSEAFCTNRYISLVSQKHVVLLWEHNTRVDR